METRLNKAIGLDIISARLLKCGAQSISHSITKLLIKFIYSLREISWDLEVL